MSYKYRITALLLTLTLFSGTFVPAALTAQQQQRERRVSTPSSTPTTAVKPTPAPTSGAKPTPTPAVKPSPPSQTITTPTLTRPPATTGTISPAAVTTPSAAPVAAPRRAAPLTLEELRAGIKETIGQTQFASSHLAVKIVSLDTGRTLYEENANKWLQPASNMKLYTVAAALDRLTPDYRFITSVYATTRPDTAGTMRGDLIVYGRGDPTFATRFTGGTDYYTAIDELASRIIAGGVRRVEGDVVGDESHFSGGTLAPGWEWDDLQWYYGAEISALTINDNAVDLSVRPGLRVGDACVVTISPATTLVTIVDRTVTAPRGTPRELRVHRPLGQNVIEVSGKMPVDGGAYSASVAISRPALMFVTMLRASLEKRGVIVTGQTRTVDALARVNAPLPTGTLIEVANRQSPPLSVIAAQTLKPSQNLYTELLLRALGKATSIDLQQTSEEAGIAAVKSFLSRAGINPDKIVMVDGSGLSRGNLVTAETTLQLLTLMSRHRDANVFRDAQPVAGVDGTLRNRMKNTPAAGNARAKTGTLNTATSLSGYVTSAAGERLAFSLMINNPPRDADARVLFTDAITVLLASFAGRS
ncbi:MAG: D-alanyl-D-alanine carboxypeptidase/D-alanyl-D-alanine-endopeptidase [Acidobacteriota bacterium]|nr:D-alanyl-D-alanine carboxypeptidase/D-alanyl-D-alanine-endopeptidase [Acidobacteriota bacterium]